MARFPLWRCALALILLRVLGDSPLVAQITAYQVTGTPPIAGNQSFNGEVGMDFAVNSPITLNALGAFDSSQNGFITNPITVRLWQKTGPSSGIQIASQTFAPGLTGALSSGHRFLDLPTAITLAAGDYTISASGYSAVEPLGNENVSSLAAAMRVLNSGGGLISFGLSRYGNTAGLYPNAATAPFVLPAGTHLDQYVFLGPSFQFTAVPEPSGVSLWILAAMAVAVGWRCQRKLLSRGAPSFGVTRT